MPDQGAPGKGAHSKYQSYQEEGVWDCPDHSVRDETVRYRSIPIAYRDPHAEVSRKHHTFTAASS